MYLKVNPYRKSILVTIIIILNLPCVAQERRQDNKKSATPFFYINTTHNTLQRSQAHPASGDVNNAGSLQHPAHLYARGNSGSQANCFDTSVRLLYNRPDGWISNDYLTRTRDGNILVPGFTYNLSTGQTNPSIIKCSPMGDTIWNRRINIGDPVRFTDTYRAFELQDSSILLFGNIGVRMPVNGRDDFLMIRLSQFGDLLWKKTFSTRLWSLDTTNGSIYISGCKQDSNGDLYICGGVQHDGPPRYSLVFKMDKAGNIGWSKGFSINYLSSFAGIDITGNDLNLFAKVPEDSYNKLVCIKMNKLNGDTSLTRCWRPLQTSDVYWKSFDYQELVRLNNGNYALFGYGNSDYLNYDSAQLTTCFGIVEVNPQFEFVRSQLFRSRFSVQNAGGRISLYPDGSGIYARIKSLSNYDQDLMIGNFQGNQITRERVIPYRGAAIGWTSNFLKLEDGGHVVTNYYINNEGHTAGVELMRLHESDTSGSCLGHDTSDMFIEPLNYETGYLMLDSISSDVLTESYRAYNGIVAASPVITTSCSQVSYCDQLKLISTRDTLCPGSSADIIIRKNRACGALPWWNVDTASVESFALVNDSTIRISFRGPWEGFVGATINGCSILKDSLKLTVLRAPARLDLGKDRVLCPGNKLSFNAGKGYAAYHWQDGSTDSVFTATKPGKYFVTVQDACGGFFSDTVLVKEHPPIPFNAGPDLTVCAGDSLTINAPAGFTGYQWLPAYGLSNDTGRTVKASPSRDTFYIVSAVLSPGCLARDSISIKVTNIPRVRLGKDSSLCEGDTLLLDAGPGYTSYLWNNAAASQTIAVNKAGDYSVKVTLYGCTAYDTLRILSVNLVPFFSLGPDTALCQGQSLDYAFQFAQASYTWNTGISSGEASLNTAGTYWLKVNVNGCSFADTMRLDYQPSPVVYLGSDTTLCMGATKLLHAGNQPGYSYLWQDGSIAGNFLATEPGAYFVKVDFGRCNAYDTINIKYTATPYFSLGKDSFTCEGQPFLLQPVLNTPATYRWQDGSNLPLYTVTVQGTYSLTASNICGSLADTILITSRRCKLLMPSAFTPDHNGLNDLFRVKYPFPVRSFHMAVYNRWGQRVFESAEISKGWDGKYKGLDVNAGTYVWVISLEHNDGAEEHGRGTVTLLR